MLFYNRDQELNILNLTYTQVTPAKMIVMTGRRRIGKTSLSLKYAENKPHLYLFVAKKTENLLCREFLEQIQQAFHDLPFFGEITHFKDIFALLLEISKKQKFVLIIDEFQEFIKINDSVFSDIQKLWDLHKAQSQMQAIFLGSVYSLMHKIFQESKEPLFGRADRILHLKPFTPHEIYNVLQKIEHQSSKTLFNYYLFTGGVPKYIEDFIENNAFDEDAMIDYIFSKGSPLLQEGKNILIEEFGKEYAIYFSILELIATGKTKRSEIESILQINISGYLERLEKDYNVIYKFNPITSKPHSKIQRYQLKDKFLRFWFSFIYSNITAIEADNISYIRKILQRDFSTYKGKILEDFYRDLFISMGDYNKVGCFWDRKGENEIDMIAVNEFDKKLVIAEIKLNKDKINKTVLKEKSLVLLADYPKYSVEYLSLSLDDIKNYVHS